MKAIFAAVTASALLAISSAAQADVASDTIALVKASGGDCLACHAIDKKVVGPAWKDVSAKYKGDAGAEAKLVEKVIKGGKGNWDKITGGVAMTPHPTKPSKEDITKIVASILKL
jgi:cytochrome c